MVCPSGSAERGGGAPNITARRGKAVLCRQWLEIAGVDEPSRCLYSCCLPAWGIRKAHVMRSQAHFVKRPRATQACWRSSTRAAPAVHQRALWTVASRGCEQSALQ